MIRLRAVSKVHKNGFKALDGVDLTVSKGEFLYLVGPSGAGKSTLLNMIFCTEEPSDGDIFIDNFSLRTLSKKQVPFYRRNVGMIFQDYKLLPNRTVYENIAFALRVMHYSRSKIRAHVMQVLELVGLQDKTKHYPSELSGGEQQRICIARAIVNDPAILLADEPTGSLDPETSWEIIHLLSKINTRKTTVIVATHNQGIVDDVRKRVVELGEGKVIRDQYLGKYE